MRQFLIFGAILIVWCLQSTDLWAVTHFEQLKAKHPFALLGDDYGILTANDLALNACIASPTPFSNDSTIYPYWQCFSLQGAKFECEDAGYDETEKSLMAIMAIVGTNEGGEHEYLTRRAISIGTCKAYHRDWKRLTAKQNHFCMLGSLIHIKTPQRDNTSWIFEAFKTKRGCESYFVGGCSLKGSGCGPN